MNDFNTIEEHVYGEVLADKILEHDRELLLQGVAEEVGFCNVCSIYGACLKYPTGVAHRVISKKVSREDYEVTAREMKQLSKYCELYGGKLTVTELYIKWTNWCNVQS